MEKLRAISKSAGFSIARFGGHAKMGKWSSMYGHLSKILENDDKPWRERGFQILRQPQMRLQVPRKAPIWWSWKTHIQVFTFIRPRIQLFKVPCRGEPFWSFKFNQKSTVFLIFSRLDQSGMIKLATQGPAIWGSSMSWIGTNLLGTRSPDNRWKCVGQWVWSRHVGFFLPFGGNPLKLLNLRLGIPGWWASKVKSLSNGSKELVLLWSETIHIWRLLDSFWAPKYPLIGWKTRCLAAWLLDWLAVPPTVLQCMGVQKLGTTKFEHSQVTCHQEWRTTLHLRNLTWKLFGAPSCAKMNKTGMSSSKVGFCGSQVALVFDRQNLRLHKFCDGRDLEGARDPTAATAQWWWIFARWGANDTSQLCCRRIKSLWGWSSQWHAPGFNRGSLHFEVPSLGSFACAMWLFLLPVCLSFGISLNVNQ